VLSAHASNTAHSTHSYFPSYGPLMHAKGRMLPNLRDLDTPRPSRAGEYGSPGLLSGGARSSRQGSSSSAGGERATPNRQLWERQGPAPVVKRCSGSASDVAAPPEWRRSYSVVLLALRLLLIAPQTKGITPSMLLCSVSDTLHTDPKKRCRWSRRRFSFLLGRSTMLQIWLMASTPWLPGGENEAALQGFSYTRTEPTHA
jgi:hypothetical protein